VTTFSALIGLTIFKLYIPKEMTLEILLKYLHFICIFAIVSAIVGQHLLLKPTMTRAEIKRLAALDAVYGSAAVILLLAAGFSLWFWVGKPAEFYSKNWIFHLKIGLICHRRATYPSLPPFSSDKQKKGPESDLVDIPPSIKYMIRLELLLLFIMPLTASLMAKGVGYFGE
jgi:putative membrane protein